MEITKSGECGCPKLGTNDSEFCSGSEWILTLLRPILSIIIGSIGTNCKRIEQALQADISSAHNLKECSRWAVSDVCLPSGPGIQILSVVTRKLILTRHSMRCTIVFEPRHVQTFCDTWRSRRIPRNHVFASLFVITRCCISTSFRYHFAI